MKAIQDWLGHSTFNVTANFYSHLDYKSRISSAEVISNALGDEDDENEGKKKTAGSWNKNLRFFFMPAAGLEPARYRYQRILSF